MWAVTALNALWLALVIAIYAAPLPDRTTTWSVTVEYRDGKPAHVFLSKDHKWRLPVALDSWRRLSGASGGRSARQP